MTASLLLLKVSLYKEFCFEFSYNLSVIYCSSLSGVHRITFVPFSLSKLVQNCSRVMVLPFLSV